MWWSSLRVKTGKAPSHSLVIVCVSRTGLVLSVRPKVNKVRIQRTSEGFRSLQGKFIHFGNPLESSLTPSASVSGCPERNLVKCNLLLLKK